MMVIVFYSFKVVLVKKKTKKNPILQKITGRLCGCNSNNTPDFLI